MHFSPGLNKSFDFPFLLIIMGLEVKAGFIELKKKKNQAVIGCFVLTLKIMPESIPQDFWKMVDFWVVF